MKRAKVHNFDKEVKKGQGINIIFSVHLHVEIIACGILHTT